MGERRIFGDLTGVRGRRRLGTVPSFRLCTIACSLENYVEYVHSWLSQRLEFVRSLRFQYYYTCSLAGSEPIFSRALHSSDTVYSRKPRHCTVVLIMVAKEAAALNARDEPMSPSSCMTKATHQQHIHATNLSP